METTSESNFYKKKYLTSIAYIVGILLFLLPFVEIRCNDASFAENSGIGLAFGTDYKVTGQAKALQDNFNSTATAKSKTSKESGKMYIAALVALSLGVIGLIFSLSSSARNASAANMITGALAAVALIILMIQINSDVRDRSNAVGSGNDFPAAIKVTANFTAWYYLSVCSFLAAAFFSFKQGQDPELHEVPPRNAPQVPLRNPGEQSEFPSSPDESELER